MQTVLVVLALLDLFGFGLHPNTMEVKEQAQIINEKSSKNKTISVPVSEENSQSDTQKYPSFLCFVLV